MIHRLNLVTAAVLLLATSTANALVLSETITLYQPGGTNAGTPEMAAMMVVSASVDFVIIPGTLNVGGSFNLTCPNSTMQVTPQNGDYRAGNGLVGVTIFVPPGSTSATRYYTDGFSSLSAGGCRVCQMQWKATAAESSIGVALSLIGTGINISFQATGEVPHANTKQANQCQPCQER